MLLWAILTLSLAILVGLALASSSLRWRLIQQQRQAAAWHDQVHQAILAVTDNVPALMQEALRVLQQEEQDRLAKLPIGAFFPTDAAAAEMEREVQRAEDHFVSATGPTRYSSGRSPGSGATSRPARSTPPARRSGSP